MEKKMKMKKRKMKKLKMKKKKKKKMKKRKVNDSSKSEHLNPSQPTTGNSQIATPSWLIPIS